MKLAQRAVVKVLSMFEDEEIPPTVNSELSHAELGRLHNYLMKGLKEEEVSGSSEVMLKWRDEVLKASGRSSMSNQTK